MSGHERWRTGGKNPYTVYRVADGDRDEQHARDHFLGSFRRVDDARRAVEAVNAATIDSDEPTQAEVDDLRWESVIDKRIGSLADAAGIDRDGLDWEEVLGAVTVMLNAGWWSAWGNRWWVVLETTDRAAAETAAYSLLHAKPEVVTGAVAAKLPVGSIVVQCETDGTPFDYGDVCGVGQGFDGWLLQRQRVRVLYRAPEAPREPLRVGDVAKPEDFEELRTRDGVVISQPGLLMASAGGHFYVPGRSVPVDPLCQRIAGVTVGPWTIDRLPGDGQDAAGGGS